MAQITLPDLSLTNSAYTDVYASTGIPVGTNLLVQNKSASAFYIQLRETTPSPTNIDGNILQPYEFLLVKTESPVRVWARGSGRLSVQIED